MEMIIGNVLFKAYIKRSQNASYSDRWNIKKPEILPEVKNCASKELVQHNVPGTPAERLSLHTTVILASESDVFCCLNISRCKNLLHILTVPCLTIFTFTELSIIGNFVVS